MKKYAATKGHGVRIGGGGKVNKETKEVLKRTYLCRHAGKANSKSSQNASSSCRVDCPWKVNIWAKKSKGYLEVTTLNDQHIGHEFHPSASQFVPMLRKLPKEILEEIRFLTVAKVNATAVALCPQRCHWCVAVWLMVPTLRSLWIDFYYLNNFMSLTI